MLLFTSGSGSPDRIFWGSTVMKFFLVFTQEVPHSPFQVNVVPSHDASKVKVEGPGQEKSGKQIKELKKRNL